MSKTMLYMQKTSNKCPVNGSSLPPVSINQYLRAASTKAARVTAFFTCRKLKPLWKHMFWIRESWNIRAQMSHPLVNTPKILLREITTFSSCFYTTLRIHLQQCILWASFLSVTVSVGTAQQLTSYLWVTQHSSCPQTIITTLDAACWAILIFEKEVRTWKLD